jgi:hypothetical protein
MRIASMANRRKERGSIPGDFAWRLIEMLESPAHRVLSLSARRILERLEIEFARHGGKATENGLLPCTFDQFADFGLDRHAIAPAIREAVALGFTEIIRPGSAGNAFYRQPTLYRITYRPWGSHRQITDEWRRIVTIEEAEAIARAARMQPPAQPPRAAKNKKPVGEIPTGTSGGKRTEQDGFPVGVSPTTVTNFPVGVSPTTSISGEGDPCALEEVAAPAATTAAAAQPFPSFDQPAAIDAAAAPGWPAFCCPRAPPAAEILKRAAA